MLRPFPTLHKQDIEYVSKAKLLPILLMLALASCTLVSAPATPATPVTDTPAPMALTRQPTQDLGIIETNTPPPLPPTRAPYTAYVRPYDDMTAYVREEPSTAGKIMRRAEVDEIFNIVGRASDNSWVHVELPDDQAGWVRTTDLDVEGRLLDMPVHAAPTNIYPFAVVAEEASLRNYPDDDYTELDELDPLTPLIIEGREEGNEWVQVAVNSGEKGWIRVEALEMSVGVESIPLIVHPEEPVVEIADREFVEEGRVSARAGGLRLRQLPSTTSDILYNLPAQTPLMFLGRIADNSWVLIETVEGFEGWVSSEYVEFQINVASLPQIDDPQPSPYITRPDSAPSAGILGGGTRQIYARGQSIGNRANVFTKVGDSLSDTPHFLRQFVHGSNLRDYGYLGPVLQYFSAGTALDGNSFISTSIAARASWSTFSALEPANADPSRCNPGETPVACEFRVVKPAVALIMIGTNDAPAFPPATYRENMRQITETAINAGVIPVLSTLPPRAEFNDNILAYNQVIVELSQTYAVPLWDFYPQVVNLPNHGLGPDGVHLSVPPGAPVTTTDFTPENLNYGTTMRNFGALQILDRVWREGMG